MGMSLEEFEEYTRNWTPDAKAAAFKAFQNQISGERRVWYCANPGRLCDGKPHEGYEYSHARSDQWPPTGMNWFIWALVGGRGSGKTRAGAEYVRQVTKKVGRLALIARTSGDVRETMVEGESGLQAVFASAGEKIHWEPSKRRITFPNGAIANTYSAEEPDRLRGPQHGFAWLDEPAHYDLVDEVWDQLLFGLRLGQAPRVAITTTPLPKKWMKARLAEPTTRASKVSTYANIDNLAPTFAQNILARYEGTRLGRQELYGEILEDVEGALWQEALIVRTQVEWESLDRIVVSIDPAGTANKRSDETGITVVGRKDRQGFLLEDASGKYSPNGWAEKADWLYRKYKADAIVAEKNFGGDMVKTTIESTDTRARVLITTAARSKQLRAEPVVALYEQGRFFHNGPAAAFTSIEEEMLTWVPGKGESPNRVDALVWGATELFGIQSSEGTIASPLGRGPITRTPTTGVRSNPLMQSIFGRRS